MARRNDGPMNDLEGLPVTGKVPSKGTPPGFPAPSPAPKKVPLEGLFALGLGLFLHWIGSPKPALFMVLLGAAWMLFPWVRSGSLPKARIGKGAWEKTWAFAGWAGFLLLCWGTVSWPNMLWVTPVGLQLSAKAAGWAIVAGVFLLLGCFWEGPQGEARDWSAGISRVLLGAVLLLAVCLRMHQLGEVPSHYWDDWAEEIVDARSFLDLGGGQLIYPLGSREPFFNYFTAALWWFTPSSPGLVAQRLSSSFQDILSILLLYFVGKGLGGRRLGILAAVLAAVNKPLLTMDLVGIHLISLTLAVGLSIFAFFRVVGSPTVGRFLFFGTALGAGIYTYSAYRPWLPFLVFCLLAWVLGRKEERPIPPLRWALAATLSGCLLLAYLVVNPFLSETSPLGALAASPMARALAVVLLVVLIVQVRRQAKGAPQGTLLLRWSAGTVWAFLLALPILSRPELTARMGGLAIFDRSAGYDLNFLARFLGKVEATVRTMFHRGQDRSDFAIPFDCYLDHPAQVAILLGLVLLLARPNWRMFFLFLAAGVGISPHVLSSDPHSGKMVGSLFPLLLIGAAGVDALWRSLSASPRFVKLLGVAFLLFLWAWGGRAAFDRLYLQWAFVKPASNAALAKECIAMGRTHRIYMSPPADGFGSGPTQRVLQEGNGTRVLGLDNTILLGSDEKVPDVAVVLSKHDMQNRERIRRDYPGATWTDVLRYPPHIPGTPPIVERVEIPSTLIGEGPGKLFPVRRLSPGGWRRTFYEGGYGLARSNILGEDVVEDPRTPFPTWHPLMLRLKGTYRSGEKGRRTFTVETANCVRLTVGGKEVFDLRPPRERPRKASKSLSLPAGDLEVEMIILLRSDRTIPPIRVESKKGGPAETL